MFFRVFLHKNLRISKKSSNFALAFEMKHAPVAQLVEQLTLNQRVQGSSPCGRTKNKKEESIGFSFLFVKLAGLVKNSKN